MVFKPLRDPALLLIEDVEPKRLKLFHGWTGIAVLETSPSDFASLAHCSTMSSQRRDAGHSARVGRSMRPHSRGFAAAPEAARAWQR